MLSTPRTVRCALLLTFLSSAALTAAPIFQLNSDQAYFAILAGNNLSLGSGGAATNVTGSVGENNDGIGSNVLVTGTAHQPNSNLCTTNCSSIQGGFVYNSAQYTASWNAWASLASQLNALAVDTNAGLVFNSSVTITPGVTSTSIFLMNNPGYVITFDGQGNSNSQFILRAPNLSLGSDVRFSFINGAQASNLIVMTSNASITTTGAIGGIIYTGSGPLTRTGGASGETLTLIGGNTAYSGTILQSAAVETATPEPSSISLLVAGAAGIVFLRRRSANYR